MIPLSGTTTRGRASEETGIKKMKANIKNSKCRSRDSTFYLLDSKFWLILLFSIFCFLFSVVSQTHAARLYLETKEHEVGIGQRMEIVLRIDSEGETVNALEGTIYTPAFLEVEAIRDGNSLISLWVERPEVRSDQHILFSGIVPNGWRGSSGVVFSFIAETNADSGSAEEDTIAFRGARVLLHDGEGTETVTKTEPLAIRVDDSIPLFDFVEIAEDTEPPEPFTPQIAQDPNIFSGDHFLVFAAQDKQSGIDHYEVLETRTYLEDEEAGPWEVAESPYRIKDQRFKSLVYVRAIDRAGNTRVAIFKPSLFDVITEPIFGKPITSLPAIGMGIVLLLIILLVYRVIRWAIIKKRVNNL